MGNELKSLIKSVKKENKPNIINNNENKEEKDKDQLGEEFILEDWEVCNDKNKDMDNPIKFDSSLLYFIFIF